MLGISTLSVAFAYTSGTDTWIETVASYDEMGRVEVMIQSADGEFDQRRYTYDDRGQLIQDTVSALGQTYYYTYDTAGNMTSWRLYDHSKGANTYGVEYGYANTGKWYDQVTTYNYQDVEYTGTGHISSYESVNSGTKSFYWNDEGKLYRARVDSTVNFEYDANGMRTSKSGTFDHEYYYEGTRLVMETVDDVKLIYLYDESGNVEAIRYNGASYYLIRNILGDVVQLRNAQNELIANYSYNAYGLPLSVTNASGTEITNEAHIALINPIRYRGYYYDNETGLYYLESRYYDPELCRFISADALLIASPIGMNLYAYCNNDPVNFVDPHGYCSVNRHHYRYSSEPCDCCENGPYPNCACNSYICPCVNGWPEEEEEEEQSGATVQKTPSTTRVAPRYTGTGNAGGGRSNSKSSSSVSITKNSAGSTKLSSPIVKKPGTLNAPKNGAVVSSSEALDMAIVYLGEDYIEASPGRFVSADGFRQVRIQDDGLMGSHAGGPHINFDILKPKYKTMHIYIFE